MFKMPNVIMALCLGWCILSLTACGGPSVSLNGTIVDAYTGQPVSNATVVIGDTRLTTDAQGRYQTLDWRTRDTLDVSASGYESVSIALESQPQIAASSETSATLTTTLRPNMLSGSVTDVYTHQPLAGAEVFVLPRSATSQNQAETPPDAGSSTETPTTPPTIGTTTDPSGRYALEGVPEQFFLTIRATDYKTLQLPLERVVSYEATLQPDILHGTVTDSYTRKPVSGAIVSIGTITTTTASDGTYLLRGLPENEQTVEIRAEGYASLAQQLEPSATLDAMLRPDVLQARLVDRDTGEPVQFATIIATTTLSSTAVAYERIDNRTNGAFTLRGLPETGYVQVLAPGYRKAVLELQPGNVPDRIELEPFQAKALYVKTSIAAYVPDRLEEFFDVIDSTELNAMVLDLKSDNMGDLGLIYYQSSVPLIQELGTSEDLMDIRGILAEAHKRNIYMIARIHVFAHDNLLAETKPEWAAQNTQGCVPNENRICNGDVFYADWDIAWLDPWNRNVWDYNIQLGVEAAQLGFDEIQFDYIRFPNDASDIEHMKLSKPTDPKNNPDPMYENITELMSIAQEDFNRAGAFFSVDIFGYAIWAPQWQIGQDASRMAPYADYICPMVYPSHYMVNELGFDNAAAHPYEIVNESLKQGQTMVGGKRARMRPWLQDFTLIWVPDPLIVEYGPEEVRAQIDATEVLTYTAGWALWSSDNDYTYDALLPE